MATKKQRVHVLPLVPFLGVVAPTLVFLIAIEIDVLGKISGPAESEQTGFCPGLEEFAASFENNTSRAMGQLCRP